MRVEGNKLYLATNSSGFYPLTQQALYTASSAAVLAAEIAPVTCVAALPTISALLLGISPNAKVLEACKVQQWPSRTLQQSDKKHLPQRFHPWPRHKHSYNALVLHGSAQSQPARSERLCAGPRWQTSNRIRSAALLLEESLCLPAVHGWRVFKVHHARVFVESSVRLGHAVRYDVQHFGASRGHVRLVRGGFGRGLCSSSALILLWPKFGNF